MGKTLADLQSNISISAYNAVTGDIEWCSGYTGFSDDIGEQAGWYLALKVSPSAEGSALEGATITATYDGTVRTLEDGETFIIRLAEGEDSITFTANKEGYSEGRLTLDLSGLEKEFVQNTCYVSSQTTGITVTPLQFGETKYLAGEVPYDTTTETYHFRLKFRTFDRVPAESELSVAHTGTSVGNSTFYTVIPLTGAPYSESIVDITITQAMINDESPFLSASVIPVGGSASDRFYCSLNIAALTLEQFTLTGTLPLNYIGIESAPLKNYIIYGTADGVGIATSSEEPTGYKIPLTVNNTQVPIYIGESQLMTNECVDYQKQKVCKTPVARWTCTFYPNYSDTGEVFIHYSLNWLMVNGSKITTFARMHLANEIVNPLTEETPNVVINETVFTTTKSKGGAGTNVRAAEGSSIRGYLVYNGIKYYTPTFNFTSAYVAEKGEFKLTFYSYEDEVTPPSPFPAITNYEGENTLSSSETVGNAELTGLILEST